MLGRNCKQSVLEQVALLACMAIKTKRANTLFCGSTNYAKNTQNMTTYNHWMARHHLLG